MATTTENDATVEPRRTSDETRGCFRFFGRSVAEPVVVPERSRRSSRSDVDAVHGPSPRDE